MKSMLIRYALGLSCAAIISACTITAYPGEGYPPPYPYPAPHEQDVSVPPGHLPPPGKCRIWYPDRPPGHQPPPESCHGIEYRTPPGARVIYGG